MYAEPQPVVANTVHPTENRQYFPALDGLRAVAFLLVFFIHYAALPWGFAGVNIFFVLSGFLITGILYDTRHQPHRARNFYIRRTLRIFPLYYGVFLLLLLLDPLMRWEWTSSWFAWPAYLGNFLILRSPAVGDMYSTQWLSAFAQLRTAHFPPGGVFLGHFWSLCVEEQFYLLWPWVVFRVRSRSMLMWICAVAVAVVPLLRVWAQHTAPPWMLHAELLYRVTPFQLDSLLLGGLIALLWRGPHQRELLAFARAVAVACSVAAVVYLAVTIYQAMPEWRYAYRYPSWKFTAGLSFINLFSAALILCALRPGGWTYRALHLRPMRWLGRISYGAYLFHDIPHVGYLAAVRELGEHAGFVARNDEVCVVLLALACTLLFAWLSFRFFESRFLGLKERWTVRKLP